MAQILIVTDSFGYVYPGKKSYKGDVINRAWEELGKADVTFVPISGATFAELVDKAQERLAAQPYDLVMLAGFGNEFFWSAHRITDAGLQQSIDAVSKLRVALPSTASSLIIYGGRGQMWCKDAREAVFSTICVDKFVPLYGTRALKFSMVWMCYRICRKRASSTTRRRQRVSLWTSGWHGYAARLARRALPHRPYGAAHYPNLRNYCPHGGAQHRARSCCPHGKVQHLQLFPLFPYTEAIQPHCRHRATSRCPHGKVQRLQLFPLFPYGEAIQPRCRS